MIITEKAKTELAEIDAKLDELMALFGKCETVTSLSIRIDEWGYDRHVAQNTKDEETTEIPYRSTMPYYRRNH